MKEPGTPEGLSALGWECDTLAKALDFCSGLGYKG